MTRARSGSTPASGETRRKTLAKGHTVCNTTPAAEHSGERFPANPGRKHDAIAQPPPLAMALVRLFLTSPGIFPFSSVQRIRFR
jgi:hypothetical protein